MTHAAETGTVNRLHFFGRWFLVRVSCRFLWPDSSGTRLRCRFEHCSIPSQKVACTWLKWWLMISGATTLWKMRGTTSFPFSSFSSRFPPFPFLSSLLLSPLFPLPIPFPSIHSLFSFFLSATFFSLPKTARKSGDALQAPKRVRTVLAVHFGL